MNDDKLDKILGFSVGELSKTLDLGVDIEEEVEQSAQKYDVVIYDTKESQAIESIDVESDIYKDYCEARSTIYGLLERGKVALENALEVAKLSEHPRAYEVVGGLMKENALLAKQLVELQKVFVDKKQSSKSNQISYTQNNIYTQSGNCEDDISTIINNLK